MPPCRPPKKRIRLNLVKTHQSLLLSSLHSHQEPLGFFYLLLLLPSICAHRRLKNEVAGIWLETKSPERVAYLILLLSPESLESDSINVCAFVAFVDRRPSQHRRRKNEVAGTRSPELRVEISSHDEIRRNNRNPRLSFLVSPSVEFKSRPCSLSVW